MTKETTNTNNFELPEEKNYPNAEIVRVTRREIKGGYIIYEWMFNSGDDEFSVSLFSSQMAEILRALGAKEVRIGKFEWDTQEVCGYTLSFNIIHSPDKKGVMRALVSDVKKLEKPKTKIEKAWDE